MAKPIRILYGNCQKKRAANLQFSRFADLSSDIIVLTEPFVGQKRKCAFFSPWNVHCTDKNSRAAIISPPWADAFDLIEYSDRDSFFCLIETNDIKFILGAIYVENGLLDNNIWIPKLNALLNICDNIIILGDSNAHSTLWGYQNSDAKGRKWEEVLAALNFEVFTDTYDISFCNSRNQSSCIDIAFGTPSLKNLVSKRCNNIIPLASDHSAWSINLNSRPAPSNETSIHLKLKETDWDRVNFTLTEKLKNFYIPDIGDKEHLEDSVIEFTSILNQTINETIKRCGRKPLHRWWNGDLSRLESEIESEQDSIIKKELIKELENKILKAKDEEWKQFSSHCVSVSDAYLKNKLLKLEKQERTLHPIKKIDGSNTKSNIETANTLLENWFKLDRDTTLNDTLLKLERKIDQMMPLDDTEDFPQVTKKEVIEAIGSLKPFSAPGCDGIPAIFLQRSCEIIEPFLTDIFNRSLLLGFTPSCWKIGRIILLPKGKGNLGTHKDYRPITLLSILVKVLEKIVLKRFQQQDALHKWISSEQYGFQPGKSVTHALMNYISYVSTHLKQKKPIIAIHLDIEGAFNSVWKPVLINRLVEAKCPNYLLNWCHDYMSNRKLEYNSKSFSTSIEVDKSTPQGGSLSPFLWNIVINPLIKIIENNGVRASVFADDVAILVSGHSWDDVATKSNKLLEIVNKWASNNALKFNSEKSEFIQYSWTRSAGLTSDIMLGGSKLRKTNKVKYLGVMLTDKLQWKSHLKYVSDKAIRNLFKLSAIVKRIWGLNGKYLKILYSGAIEPILLHACAIWAAAIPKKTLMKPLVRVQRLAAQFITRTNKKAHTSDTLMLAGILPIECRAKELSLRWWAGAITDIENPCSMSIDQIPLHDKFSSHFSSLQQLEGWNKQLGIMKEDLNMEHSKIKTRLKRPTPESLIAASEAEVNSLNLDNFSTKYFTDGSKSDEGVGTAFTKWENGIMTGSWGSCLHNSTSIFKAELLGIDAALDDIGEGDTHIAIISDSQAALKALKNPSTNSLVEKTRMKLIRSNRSKSVILGWTKAHVGTKENEIVDQLAKNVAKNKPECPLLNIDKMDLLKIIKSQIMTEWQVSWDFRRGKWSHLWNKRVKKIMRTKDFNNIESELLNNFFAGSSPFNHKLNLWGLRDSPKCEADIDEDETPRHFLFHCSNTRDLRRNLMNIARNETGFYAISMNFIWKSNECLSLLAEELQKRFHPDM